VLVSDLKSNPVPHQTVGHSVNPIDPSWYSRIPYTDRQHVDAVARWLSPVAWQLFLTLSFPWNLREETADRKFRAFLNILERELRTRICFLGGKERKPRSYGMEVPWHFHVLMTAERQIPPNLVGHVWRSLVGSGHKDLLHPDGDSIEVRAVERGRLAVEYCLKLASDCHGDWLFRWLEFFNPNIRQSGSNNHRKVRQRRLWQEQQTSSRWPVQ
jgi:hypothetical protein